MNKYEFRVREGRYQSNGHWEKEWDFSVGGDSLMNCHNTININSIQHHQHDNSIAISLNKIPARIDLDRFKYNKTIWLLDEHDAEMLPQPYGDHDPITVYQHGEREQATIEEVGCAIG